jgi:hypothetical protein
MRTLGKFNLGFAVNAWGLFEGNWERLAALPFKK